MYKYSSNRYKQMIVSIVCICEIFFRGGQQFNFITFHETCFLKLTSNFSVG